MPNQVAPKLTLIADPAVNLTQWYTDVCRQAQLFAYGPVKGTIIIKPYALKIWHFIKSYLTTQFDDVGVEEVYFPMLIPARLLKQEINQIDGFRPELIMVNQIGEQKLTEPLYVRPTSESLIADYFHQTIKSYRDLPVKYNQWCNAMRWEKNTRPFLRNSEFLWQEGHAAHLTAEHALNWQKKIWSIYQRLITKLMLVPIFSGLKTKADTFAGALQTLTVEAVLPQGYTLQCATSHYFGQKLAKIYQIKFQNIQQQQTWAFTTSWGLSTRLIGALVMTHSDRQGLVLPWNLAPIQIMIIPYNWTNPPLIQYVRTIVASINHPFRMKINRRDQSFGFRIKAAVAQGIPIQIIVGLKNMQNQTVTINRRDLNQTVHLPTDKLCSTITAIVANYDRNLLHKAQQRTQQSTAQPQNWPDFQRACRRQKLIKMVFCGEAKCETAIKQTTHWAARCLLTSFEPTLICLKCQKSPGAWSLFARSY